MNEKPEAPRLPWSRRIWRAWLRPLIVVLVVLSSFRSAVADWHDVPTQSMEPTILVGDRIAVNKLAYGLKIPFTTAHVARWGEPARGEVVVFFAPGSGTRMVKRVIGEPGDRVALARNRLVVNGVTVPLSTTTAAAIGADDLTDPPPRGFVVERLDSGPHPVMLLPTRGAPRSFQEVVVPPGHYLVMGDNRDNSGDSRVFGFVPADEIVGRAFGVALSFDRDASYRPRWKRWFRGLS